MPTLVAKTLELGYDPAEDRILVDCRDAEGRRWILALTRRLTAELDRQVLRVLEETSPLARRVPAEHRAEAFAMERERLAGELLREPVVPPTPIPRAPGLAPRLVHRIAIGLTERQATVTFIDETGQATQFPMDRPRLHRFSAYLERQARRGEWRLREPDPEGGAKPN